jgi:transcriptional regulator with XRE-family HTH domain
MRITIHSPADLGQVIRSVRRHSKVRLDDLAATAGVSKQFTSDVEHGKPTVQLGRVLKLLSELGVSFELDIPEEAARALATLRGEGGVRQGTRPGRGRADVTSPSGGAGEGCKQRDASDRQD